MAASDPRVAGSNEGSDQRRATLEGVSELWIASHRPWAIAIVIIVAEPFRQLWGSCGW